MKGLPSKLIANARSSSGRIEMSMKKLEHTELLDSPDEDGAQNSFEGWTL